MASLQASIEAKSTSDTKPAKDDDIKLHGSSIKEIASCEIVKITSRLESGTYGSCYLANYRGMLVAVKEFRLLPNTDESTIK